MQYCYQDSGSNWQVFLSLILRSHVKQGQNICTWLLTCSCDFLHFTKIYSNKVKQTSVKKGFPHLPKQVLIRGINLTLHIEMYLEDNVCLAQTYYLLHPPSSGHERIGGDVHCLSPAPVCSVYMKKKPPT